MIELLVLRDGREVDRYMLGAGATTLGRADECDLLLDDSAVSRMHARVTVEGGRVFLADLGSGNGTWFQGLKVREMEVEDGAEFRIEPFTLRIAISRTNAGAIAAATRPVDASRPPEPVAMIEASTSLARTPGGSAAVGPRLERVRGNEGPILLGRSELVLGRGDDASLPLRDGSISRRHAKLTFADDRFTLEDLRSANGTWVNGERLSGSRILKDGDRLRFGDTELLFADPSAGTLSAAEALVPTKPVLLDEEPAREAPAAELIRAARRSPTPHPERSKRVDLYEPEIPLAEEDAPAAPRGTPALASLAESEGQEHTEAGAPPPSAFQDVVAPPIDETGSGGGFIELSAVGPAPGDREGVGRRWLLAGVAIGLVLFVAALAVRPPAPTGEEPEPDKVQRTMLLTMERMTVEAEAALAKEPKDFATALDHYGRVSTFGRREELLPFARARELQRSATESVSVLHEALLTRALRDETRRRADTDGATSKKIAAYLAAANEGVVAGRRGSLDGYDRALRSLADALALSPGNADATRLLAEAKPERDALARKQAAASRDRIDRECRSLHGRASAKQAVGSAESLKAAIGLHDQILRTDDTGVTEWRDRARADKERALRSLAAIVAPLRESARRSMAANDCRAARKFLRKALALNPFDPQIGVERDAAQADCLRNAVHQLQMTKAYGDARNDGEAIKSIDLGQTFADRPEDKLWQQLEEERKKIRRDGER